PGRPAPLLQPCYLARFQQAADHEYPGLDRWRSFLHVAAKNPETWHGGALAAAVSLQWQTRLRADHAEPNLDLRPPDEQLGCLGFAIPTVRDGSGLCTDLSLNAGRPYLA